MATTSLRSDLQALVDSAVAIEPDVDANHEELAIAFFDLVGSTQLKVDEGHLAGSLAALQHNGICQTVGEACGGTVIKSLGDGLLMTFPSSRDAAVASVNVQAAIKAHTSGLQSKVGITVGAVQKLTVLGQPDIAGSAVDRCARLQALASAGEIVVDEPFVSSVKTHLGDFSDIDLQGPRLEVLKGLGDVRVRSLVGP